jgi:hypothetical protein
MKQRSRADRVSLTAGVALALLGGLLCLDQLDLVSLSFGVTAAALCAVAGAILVASGLVPEDTNDGGEDD